MREEKIKIATEAEMRAQAQSFAREQTKALTLFLTGDLGVGKTTWTRGFLAGLGYTDVVKSPTYAIVESYPTKPFAVHHFDWYRIQGAEELEEMGIRDYWDEPAFCIVEWPDKGKALGLMPDVRLDFQYEGEGRLLTLQYLNN